MTRMMYPFLFLLAAGPAAFGQTAPPAADPAPPPADAGATVYRKVLGSTAWVHSDRGGGRVATGSGSLVDRGRRLVLTNYHVVGDVKKATVFFPDYGADKKAIPERKHYLDRAGKLGISGEVVEVDKEGDLALIRIDRVPDGVHELTLAASSPDPGEPVHSIGNPGKSGALWVYTPGKVRQVYSKKWKAKLDEKTVQTFEAKVIETDSPTNPGDSGGPLVNDKGELVGVTQGGAIDAQSLSIFVDLSEVKRLMNRRSVQALRSTEPAAVATQVKDKDPPKKDKEPAKPHREAVLKSKDDGKFFSEEAWKKVQPAAEKMLKEKNMDLLVETFAVTPKGDADKLKAMTAAEREKFFKEYAEERCKAEKINGVYVFACKNPGFLWVELSGPATSAFPSGFGSILSRKMLAQFKEKKYDDGLKDALNLILETTGLAEKKEEKKEEKK
jgi:S1-C subfamily serine protease